MRLRAITFALASLTLLATACSAEEGIYLMRIDNQRDQDLQLRYGDVSFGTVEANTMTVYVEVDPGPSDLYLGGQVLHADLELGRNLVGEHYWTYTIQDLAHGLSADDGPQRMLTIRGEEEEAEELEGEY